MVAAGLLVDSVVNGVLLGGIYAIVALGLSVIFGVLDEVNLAHGHFLMVGAYVAILLFSHYGVNPLAGMFAALALLFIVGVAVQRLLDQVEGGGHEHTILITFGIAMVLQNLGVYFLGSQARTTDLGLGVDRVSLGLLDVSAARLTTFVVAVALVVLVWAFLRFTWTGKAIRATAQNDVAAEYVGIDTPRTATLSFGLGAMLAGAGGALLSMLFPMDPYVGWVYLLKAFAVVVLGGVGSIVGTLVGGLVLGLSENVGALYLGGAYRDVISFVILLLVLLVLPRGLFGTTPGGE